MRAGPKLAFSVAVCEALIRVAGLLVPATSREEWISEWQAEIRHRWLFLHHVGAWSTEEALRLLLRSLGAFLDAGWYFTSQDSIQGRVHESVRSPWTCLGAIGAAVALVAIVSAGLPATRDLFRSTPDASSGRLLFVWRHPSAGGGDKGVPADVTAAWSRSSRLLDGAAAFRVRHESVQFGGRTTSRVFIITTEPALFSVLGAEPSLGRLPNESGVLLTYSLWRSLFHGDARVLGSHIRIGRESYRISGVLGSQFRFLSRQPALYVVLPTLQDAPAMIVARLRPSVPLPKLDHELTRISEVSCYYFFQGELRYAFPDEALWIPVKTFAISIVVSGLLLTAVSGIRMRHVYRALQHPYRAALIRRMVFWSAKTVLALAFVFLAGLEWARSGSSMLFGSHDPASGPFLLWLYVLGAMAVFFWSAADQRGRCRVCLRLLCFPVRIGCPGCLLLDWSGTELLCSEGHGVLHVPHMHSSWEEEGSRWIALDDSWKELFAGDNK